jgi:hypothetical protein
LKKQLKAAELLQELTVETIPNHTSLSEMWVREEKASKCRDLNNKWNSTASKDIVDIMIKITASRTELQPPAH